MSGALSIGECLSDHLGTRCLAREDLLAAVNKLGESAARVTARIEDAVDAYQEFSELRRPYLIFMKQALLGQARQGRLVYFGYSGHLLLNPVRHFVRIRLIAPMDVRVARTQERLGYSEAEALDYVRRVDRDRTRWARLMYGLDIRDTALYDLTLNLERMSSEGACELVRELMLQADFQATPESIRDVENDFLATEVLAALMSDPRTLSFELGATAADGVVRLEGPYLSEDDHETVFSIASTVSGVRGVEYEPGYAPTFRF